MTKQDFDLILIESFIHSTKQSYFNGKREEYRCDVEEYCNGLNESLKRLNDEVNKPDYEYCEIMFPSGTVRTYIGFARSTIEAKFKDPLDEESQFQIDDCKIVYPRLRTKFEYFGKPITLSVEIMAAIWVDLEKYLQSVAPDQPQQHPKADHSALLKALSKHVTGIYPDEFTNIIENHQLKGTKKAKWIGSEKSEARYFANIFHLTIKEFNNCFAFEDNTKLMNQNRPTTKKPFQKLLSPFINK
jgi:hypothetical protein